MTTQPIPQIQDNQDHNHDHHNHDHSEHGHEPDLQGDSEMSEVIGFKFGLEEAEKAAAEIDKDSTQLSYDEYQKFFTKGIDMELSDLDATVEQIALLRTSVVMYLQARIDNHLADLLPDEYFANLDEKLETGEYTPEEVIGITLGVYEALMGKTLLSYVHKLYAEVIPEVKASFKENAEGYTAFQKLSDEDKEKFTKAIEAEDFEAAEKLLLAGV